MLKILYYKKKKKREKQLTNQKIDFGLGRINLFFPYLIKITSQIKIKIN